MRKILAIGGGGIYVSEFVDEIISFTEKSNQNINVLIIPTAQNDDPFSTDSFSFIWEQRALVYCDRLYTVDDSLFQADQAKFLIEEWADVIWVPGGNTLLLMKIWRRRGLDRMLAVARDKGVVLCGSSAGMLCWFECGHSDAMSYYRKMVVPDAVQKDWEYINVQCLDFIEGITGCPHLHSQNRFEDFLNMFRRDFSMKIGIGLDDYVAMQIKGDEYRIISTDPDAHGYVIYRTPDEDNNLTQVEMKTLPESPEYSPLSDLYKNYFPQKKK
eukprot:TRINITY_DN7461_c0_g1_i1.p1 TRINITY_DN7461_c0_g1~~TRINITY_DN7461_c0_g1_i1.p1  ORF type:complete len:271 (-),score=43.12 TRINITY_DN7461_c0_g1_i1:59-871(-)